MRASEVEMAARQRGDVELADAVADWAGVRPWSAVWAACRPPGDLYPVGRNPSLPSASAVTVCEGRSIAVIAGYDKSVRIWDLESGCEHGDPLLGLSHKADAIGTAGDVAVIGDAGGHLRVWNLRSRRLVGAPFKAHGNAVTSVAATTWEGGTIAVSSSNDRMIRRWDLESRERLGDPLPVSLALSQVETAVVGGRPVVVARLDDRAVRLWDLVTGAELADLTDDQPVSIFALGESGGRPILATGTGHRVRLWYLESGEPLGEPIAHGDTLAGRVTESLRVLAFAQVDGRTMVLSCTWQKSVRLFELDGATRTMLTDGFGYLFDAAPVRVAGRPAVLLIERAGGLTLWRLDRLPSRRDRVWEHWTDRLAVCSRERVVVSAGPSGQVWARDLETGAQVGTACEHGAEVTAVVADGQATVFSAGGHTLSAWRPGRRMQEKGPFLLHDSPIAALAAVDDRRLLIGDGRSHLHVVDVGERRIVRSFDLISGGPMRALVVGAPIAVAASPLRAWDLDAGEQRWRAEGDCWSLALVELDGEPLVAAGYEDGGIGLWKVGSGERVATLAGHRESVYALAHTWLDGRPILASGSWDGTLRLWDLDTGGCALEIDIGDPVYSLAFAPRRMLIVGHRRGMTALRLTESLPAAEPAPPPPAEGLSPLGQAKLFTGWKAPAAMLEEGLHDLDEMLHSSPEDDAARYTRGWVRRRLSHYQEAYDDLSEVLRRTPDDLDARFEYGVACSRVGRYDDAVAALTAVLEKRSSNVYVLTERGKAYNLAGREALAVGDFDRALAIQPGYAYALKERGLIRRKLYRYDEALSDYARALEAEPRNAWLLQERGTIFYRQGLLEDSAADLALACEIDNERLWARCFRARSLLVLGREAEAEAEFLDVLSGDELPSYVYLERANFLANTGRYDEALTMWDRAREVDPGYAGYILAAKTDFLVRTGRNALAVMLWRMHPSETSRAVLVNAAQALTMHGELDEAERLLEQVPAKGREALVFAGAIRWHKGDRERALELFGQARLVYDECTPFRLAETFAIAAAGTDEPGLGLHTLRGAMRLRLPSDQFQAGLYGLLVDLPGIGQLRKMVAP